MRLNKILCLIFAFVLLINFSPAILGQQESKERQKAVSEQKELITKVIKLKYADAEELEEILFHFVTMKKGVGAHIAVNESYNAIVVRDFPEKIAVIEEVIKQFDVKPAEVEFNLHLLEALDIPAPIKPVQPVKPVPPVKPVQPVKPVPPVQPLPPDVQPIVQKLKTNFRYKDYHLIDTASLRSTDSSSSSIRLGGSSNYTIDINIEWSLLSPDSSTIKISRFRIYNPPRFAGDSILSTSLMLEDGKPVVVGTSKAAPDDRALIIILTGRILKD